MRKRTRAREYAIQIFYQIDVTGDPVDMVLERFWRNVKTDPEVVTFATELIRTMYRNLAEIDETIAKYSENWKIERMAAIDRCILRLGVCELFYRDDIPFKVSINEAVELANKFSTPDSGKFINGILDKLVDHSESNSSDSETA